MFQFLTPIRARIFLMVGTVSIVGTVYMTARVGLWGSKKSQNSQKSESLPIFQGRNKNFLFFLSKNLKTECRNP